MRLLRKWWHDLLDLKPGEYIMSVTTQEASGLSGAGSRAGKDRNPRINPNTKLVVPKGGKDE